MGEYIPGKAIPRTITLPKTPDYIPGQAIPRSPTLDTKLTDPSQPQEQLSQFDVKNVIKGNSLELIRRVGWGRYRKLLEGLTYSQFISEELEDIHQFETASQAQQQPTKETVIQQNKEASIRTETLIDDMSQQYPVSKGLPYYCEYSERVNKFNSHFGKNDRETKKITRFYIGFNGRNTPEVFQSLFEELSMQTGLNNTTLSLNKVNMGQDGVHMSFDTNNIILYLQNDHLENFDLVVKAINLSKQKHPELWEMSMKDEAGLRRKYLSEFLIPIDRNVAIVEMPDLNSYHTTSYLEIYRHLLGSRLSSRGQISLENRLKLLKGWTPDKPSSFGELYALQKRQKHMPALLIKN